VLVKADIVGERTMVELVAWCQHWFKSSVERKEMEELGGQKLRGAWFSICERGREVKEAGA